MMPWRGDASKYRRCPWHLRYFRLRHPPTAQLLTSASRSDRSTADSNYFKADQQFPGPPAVIQLLIMIGLFAEAGAGELRLSHTLEVHNSFSSIAGGGSEMFGSD